MKIRIRQMKIRIRQMKIQFRQVDFEASYIYSNEHTTNTDVLRRSQLIKQDFFDEQYLI
jgi:hypothetical protein